MESRERVIDLLALIRTVLKKWRIMLIFGILLALLSAVYFGVYKNRNTVEAVNSEVALEDDESPDIYAAELEIIDNSIANKNRYIQNSKLLQLDPNAVSRAYIRFSIQMDDTGDNSEKGTGEEVAMQGVIEGQQTQNTTTADTADNASANMVGSGENATDSVSQVYLDDKTRKAVLILRHYINAVNYNTDYDKLSSLLGIDKEYIRELVWASVEDEAALSGNIQAVFSDEENAVMIAEQALETLRGDKAAATGLYGRHKVIVEPAVVRTTSDRSYNTQLKERLQEMNDLKTQKDNFQKNFNLTEKEVEEIIDTEKKISKRELVKYGVIGFILGCLLFLFVYAVILIASGILLSSRELGRMFGIDKLAVVPDSKIKNVLDRLISGIGSDRFSSRDEKIAYQIAAENICEKLSGLSGSGSVAVVTDLGEGPADGAGQILEEFLKDKNISISVLPHLNQSPKELNGLKSCDTAVLLLQGGFSRLRHVSEFQNTLRTYKKTVLGSIVIE